MSTLPAEPNHSSPSVCLNNQTIGDELDGKMLPWHFSSGAVGTSSNV